ncbi:unnamed protein product [Polarella glacialis]|uniref:Uncharacterized protein n=1 Tax=Polarella glacialis TaxID=89957 RepID=A0A813D3L9_POLGL|nr:unnamed protein product [Polarella glacialis]
MAASSGKVPAVQLGSMFESIDDDEDQQQQDDEYFSDLQTVGLTSGREVANPVSSTSSRRGLCFPVCCLQVVVLFGVFAVGVVVGRADYTGRVRLWGSLQEATESVTTHMHAFTHHVDEFATPLTGEGREGVGRSNTSILTAAGITTATSPAWSSASNALPATPFRTTPRLQKELWHHLTTLSNGSWQCEVPQARGAPSILCPKGPKGSKGSKGQDCSKKCLGAADSWAIVEGSAGSTDQQPSLWQWIMGSDKGLVQKLRFDGIVYAHRLAAARQSASERRIGHMVVLGDSTARFFFAALFSAFNGTVQREFGMPRHFLPGTHACSNAHHGWNNQSCVDLWRGPCRDNVLRCSESAVVNLTKQSSVRITFIWHPHMMRDAKKWMNSTIDVLKRFEPPDVFVASDLLWDVIWPVRPGVNFTVFLHEGAKVFMQEMNQLWKDWPSQPRTPMSLWPGPTGPSARFTSNVHEEYQSTARDLGWIYLRRGGQVDLHPDSGVYERHAHGLLSDLHVGMLLDLVDRFYLAKG